MDIMTFGFGPESDSNVKQYNVLYEPLQEEDVKHIYTPDDLAQKVLPIFEQLPFEAVFIKSDYLKYLERGYFWVYVETDAKNDIYMDDIGSVLSEILGVDVFAELACVSSVTGLEERIYIYSKDPGEPYGDC